MTRRTEEIPNDYEHGQINAIQVWKSRSPSVISRAAGYALKPVSWAIGKVVPPSAVEAALRGAHWAASRTFSEERIVRDAGVGCYEELNSLELEALDRLARDIHRYAVGYAVLEGGTTGAAGLAGIAADIPAVIMIALRTIQGIGTCYGYRSNLDVEREYNLGILSVAGANSLKEKTSSLLFLRELQVTILHNTFKAMGEKAATRTLGKEAAIVGLRNLARRLGVNLTKRKLLQAIPATGAAIGAAVNATFISDVAWAARRSYQERWLRDRGYTLE